jgi:imidazolonepropionase-like amidohydrolase
VQAILTPRSRRRPNTGKEDTSGSSIETSGTLEKAAVPFAVAPLGTSVSLDGLPGRDLTSLMLEAAYAVRGGASEKTALEALTITPAKMLGLDKKIGSIEEGKDADLLILNGPPLDYRTHIERALVGGKIYYDRLKEKIYPDLPNR